MNHKKRLLRIVGFLAIVTLSFSLGTLLEHAYFAHRHAGVLNSLRINGLTAMTASQLRETVISNKLRVYWAGPEPKVEYLLDASNRSAIVLTILPMDRIPKARRATFPEITTYTQDGAFQAVLEGGGNTRVSGFINDDGNSVFYTKLDPDDVYVGFRGLDVEVQIFDSSPGQSLALARESGRLKPMK